MTVSFKYPQLPSIEAINTALHYEAIPPLYWVNVVKTNDVYQEWSTPP